VLSAYLLIAILVALIVLFIWGRWRYDVVAFVGLMFAVLVGVVPYQQAFSGFSHPAVLSVGFIMIITRAISQSGVLDYFINKLEVLLKSTLAHITTLTFVSAVLSAFMNNVGALGLMMPIAIQSFIKRKKSPSLILMPIAFGSVLGGLTTAIGTPPNLLIAHMRQELLGKPFGMFDFTPVGILVAIAGVSFISLIGWRLIPLRRKGTKEDDFQISDYLTEVTVPEDSPMVEKTIGEFFSLVDADFDVIAIIHKKNKKFAYNDKTLIRANDVLIIEASHENLEILIKATKFTLSAEKPFTADSLDSNDLTVIEAVVPPSSFIMGKSAKALKLRARYSINLLAISRESISFKQNLSTIRLQGGDVVLLQGAIETLRDDLVNLGFLPLAQRDISVGLSQQSVLPFVFFITAILAVSFHMLPITIALGIAIAALLLFKVITTRGVYESIDWSVLLLLSAMIPLGQAMESTGVAQLITDGFMRVSGDYSPIFALAAILIITMTLSDVMNNAATAVMMAPIAINVAQTIQVNVDSFLMAVAIGASCSFLTPIAHQNNTMVMGPGNYQFFDYYKMGLPLEIIIVVISVPSIIWFWPL